MYLKSLQITNFRKFSNNENIIEFVDSKKSLQENINIALATTLIVGKNNSGKTTITKALEILTSSSPKFYANDFNFRYLNNILTEYKENNFENIPTLIFKLFIGFDKNIKTDLVTNIFPFMTIENTNDSYEQSFEINIKYEIVETETFINNVKAILEKYNTENKKTESKMRTK